MNRKAIEARLRANIGPEFSRGLHLLGNHRVRRWVLRWGKEFGRPWIWKQARAEPGLPWMLDDCSPCR